MRGKAGAGKTFRAKKLCEEKRAQLLSVDELMEAMFGTECAGKEATLEREKRVLDYFLLLALRNFNIGVSTVIDHGFWRKDELLRSADFLAKEKISCEICIIEADFKTRLERVLQRNDGRVINEAKLRLFDGWYEN